MINPFTVIKLTEKEYNLTQGAIVSKNKRKTHSEARNVAMFLTAHLTNYSPQEIGDHFDRQRGEVMSSCKRIEKIVHNTLYSRILTAMLNITRKLEGG